MCAERSPNCKSANSALQSYVRRIASRYAKIEMGGMLSRRQPRKHVVLLLGHAYAARGEGMAPSSSIDANFWPQQV